MLRRIITAIIAILVFIPICIYSNTLFFPIAIAILSLVAVFEMVKCLNFHKNLFLSIPLYLVAIGLPVFRCFVKSNAFFLSLFMYLISPSENVNLFSINESMQ